MDIGKVRSLFHSQNGIILLSLQLSSIFVCCGEHYVSYLSLSLDEVSLITCNPVFSGFFCINATGQYRAVRTYWESGSELDLDGLKPANMLLQTCCLPANHADKLLCDVIKQSLLKNTYILNLTLLESNTNVVLIYANWN